LTLESLASSVDGGGLRDGLGLLSAGGDDLGAGLGPLSPTGDLGAELGSLSPVSDLAANLGSLCPTGESAGSEPGSDAFKSVVRGGNLM